VAVGLAVHPGEICRPRRDFRYLDKGDLATIGRAGSRTARRALTGMRSQVDSRWNYSVTSIKDPP